ncbi:SUMO-targeted ubiquitin ligase complex subunit slx8 [Imshaugia aleurites]|uniref:SUMO-targeted ubiquitin ligase complex subunit slx8 n=1 Tax=Imshaugia aleurites TaxID=172621 RepID=A0A8H3I7Z0_9LECA|nr:SUMO-targeted ubiquitin ligase complex subunit slx8 [Imshaugia aleurites]
MDDSDDSNHEDVWSPTLREDVFSNHDMMGHSWSGEPRHRVEHLPLPNFNSIRSQPLNHINWPNSQSHQQLRGHNNTAPTKSSSSSSRHPLSTTSVNRNRSHLDLPNFPLQASPVGEAPNSSGRPPPPPPPPPRRATPSRAPPRPTRSVSEDSWSSSSGLSSSDREDTPWPDTEDLSDFVDLTADSSPPNMPPANPQRRQPPSRMSRNTSSAPSNPAKRRKVEASQSSYRAHKIEEIDLRDFGDDTGLLKVLEQQRMATIKAQQEQANKPVKLSTLQCIICMETMKDLTATHCGHLFCHACLMEALIAGESQGSEPGKGTPKCPVCRKKVVRPSDHRRDNHNVVPLAMKLGTKSRSNKGKGKAVDGDYA